MHKTFLKKGFTLIELLVAIGIFGVIITIITGVFTRFMIVERRGIAQGQIISDLRSSMESFIKEARTGYGSTYTVGFAINGSVGSAIAFRNQIGECVSYRVNGPNTTPGKTVGVFERASVGNISGTCDPAAVSGAIFSPLTSATTKISQIHFIPIIATESGGRLTKQGTVTISIRSASKSSDISPIDLQSTVVSRQMLPYAL